MGTADEPGTSQPTGFDTETLARLVRSTPDEQLLAGLRVNRDVLIGEIFRRFPERLSEEGRHQSGVLKFKIGGREDGGVDRWYIVLRNGTCETGRDLDLKPKTTISVSALDFIKLVTGNANPVELFLTRRLRVRGNLVFAARMPSLFTIPGRR
jgi:putative sterol carrier protein